MFNVQLSLRTWNCNYKTCPQKSYEASALDSGSMGLGKLMSGISEFFITLLLVWL